MEHRHACFAASPSWTQERPVKDLRRLARRRARTEPALYLGNVDFRWVNVSCRCLAAENPDLLRSPVGVRVCLPAIRKRYQRHVATTLENYPFAVPTEPRRRPKDGPRTNDEIRNHEVQLIDKDGANHGVTKRRRHQHGAGGRARSRGDLAELSPAGCKIMDYGKFKYQAQKKAAEARKKQKVVEIKEIKLRPMIDDHDYEVKMRAMQRFFEEGDKVKVTLRFRGREMAHQEIGTKLLDQVKSDVANRQGRAGRPLRRPSGRDGSGAALKRRSRPSGSRGQVAVPRRRQASTPRIAVRRPPSAISAPFRRPADQGLPWRRSMCSSAHSAHYEQFGGADPRACGWAGRGACRQRRAKCPS